MPDLAMSIFFWLVLNYIIWLPLGTAISSVLMGLGQLLLLFLGIVCLGVILVVLAWLLLSIDSMDRFGARG